MIPTDYNFNSIKVRLELKDLKKEIDDVTFQFHKGTIRTEKIRRVKEAIEKFQFHKGTIRTAVRLCQDAKVAYFNSIKVRLELLSVLSEITTTPISIP